MLEISRPSVLVKSDSGELIDRRLCYGDFKVLGSDLECISIERVCLYDLSKMLRNFTEVPDDATTQKLSKLPFVSDEQHENIECSFKGNDTVLLQFYRFGDQIGVDIQLGLAELRVACAAMAKAIDQYLLSPFSDVSEGLNEVTDADDAVAELSRPILRRMKSETVRLPTTWSEQNVGWIMYAPS